MHSNFLFKTRLWTSALTVFCAMSAQPASSKTLGYVITTWNLASYETRFIDECPEGMAVGYDELWWRGLSKAERGRLTQNGLLARQDRYSAASRRGPQGQDTCIDPASVEDPPMLTVEGKTAYGFDLDNNTDGTPTPKTCSHETFTSPAGHPGIDNQVYRLLGCNYGFRSFGYFDANPNDSRRMQGLGVILLEISGVEDARNDDSVEVSFYRSIDPYPIDAQSDFIPYASFRIDVDNGKPRYGSKLKGKIVDGVLSTEPGDTHLPYYGNYAYMDMFLRDMRLELKINDDVTHASGTFGGYLDVEELTYYIGSLGVTHSTTYTDCASIWRAAHRLADGYPDPKTGKCTSLSAAYHVKAVAAHIIHPAVPSAAAGSQ